MLSEKDKKIILALADNNMKWKITAYSLGMHWNSVWYRLGKIYDNTGLDPRNFYDLHKLVQIVKGGDTNG